MDICSGVEMLDDMEISTGGSAVKDVPANAGDLSSIPVLGKIPWRRKWQPTPVFLLGNPMDRGAWWATVCGAQELDTTKTTPRIRVHSTALFQSWKAFNVFTVEYD